MKKFCFLILFLILIFCPFPVFAASIAGVSVNGVDSVSVGEVFTLTFSVDFNGVQKNSPNTHGVAAAAFYLDYDENVFSLVKITDIKDFQSTLVYVEQINAVLGSITENNFYQDKCMDEILHCNSYQVKVTFFVKDTSFDTSAIRVVGAEAGLYQLDLDGDYEDQEPLLLQSNSSAAKTIHIVKKENEVVEEPPAITPEVKSKDALGEAVTTSDAKNKSNSELQDTDKEESSATFEEGSSTKGANTYLSSLEIEQYKINFNKEKLEYKISLNKNTNKLNIKATCEDSHSSVTVLGADDLKKNNNIVLVEVVAEDGSKKTYTIKTYPFEEEEVEKGSFFPIKLNKKMITFLIILLIVFFVFSLIVLIMRGIKNKKIDKLLDEFDKM